MAVTHHLLVGAALALAFFSGSVTEAGEVGVCYGMMASQLIKPPVVVQLLLRRGIKAVALYDADREALNALAGTGIKVGVSLPNGNLADAAGDMAFALQWVATSVKAYPNTRIDSVAVGNEVFHQVRELTPKLLPAMKNIHSALDSLGLADDVKVITPIALDALKDPSFPPSLGEFRDDFAQLMMIGPMLDFLEQTGSYLSFNIYPYFAYKANPRDIDRAFVLFLTNNGQLDPNNGLTYFNLFDAMTDAVFHAVEKLRSSRRRGRMLDSIADDPLLQSLRVKESGHPNLQHPPPSQLVRNDSLAAQMEDASTSDDAQIYNSNLISKILRGGGTPYKPNAVISANIFSLFNEDLKPGDDDERHFGLFYPDGREVYHVDFVNPGPSPAPAGPSWCTANAAVGSKRLQDALDYACGHGADCSAIQPGKACYQPNTLVAHASYAFNDFYQKKKGTCDFDGAATVVYQRPAACNGAAAASWCRAKEGATDARLQAALDYACGHGANCAAIQRGGRCFDPNTKVAHASYAMNDYYQQNGKSDQSCDFGGAGNVVYQRPQFGNCVF